MSAGRKTLRRTQRMAETFAAAKRAAGHSDVTITKITPTDWAITWDTRGSPLFYQEVSTVLHADEIRIDNDEGRITLVIDVDPSWRAPEGRLTFDIHSLALEFYDEVRRELGPYVYEAEQARTMVRAGLGPNGEQVDDGGYALDDPKSPGYHDRMVGDH